MLFQALLQGPPLRSCHGQRLQVLVSHRNVLPRGPRIGRRRPTRGLLAALQQQCIGFSGGRRTHEQTTLFSFLCCPQPIRAQGLHSETALLAHHGASARLGQTWPDLPSGPMWVSAGGFPWTLSLAWLSLLSSLFLLSCSPSSLELTLSCPRYS